MILDSDAIKALEDKHGEELLAVNTVLGTACFRAPKGVEMERLQEQMLGDKDKGKAAKILAASCVVHPDRDTFLGWCEKRGGIPLGCLGPLNKFAGLEVEVIEKK